MLCDLGTQHAAEIARELGALGGGEFRDAGLGGDAPRVETPGKEVAEDSKEEMRKAR